MITTTIYQDLEPGQRITLDNNRVVITLEQKSGRRARLKLDIDASIKVRRPIPAISTHEAHECSPND